MTTTSRPFVDFQQVKRVVSLPDVFEAFGLLDQFERRGETLTGVCPLPQHQHGPYPNRQQFKARIRDGIWQWFCHGDCKRGGTVIDAAMLLSGFDNAHVRLWFADHFGERLTLSKPKKNGGERHPPKEEAREVVRTPSRAEAKDTSNTLPTTDSPIKPLRFKLKLETPVPYLRQRGVTDATAEKYGLGLCTKGILKGYVAIPVYRCPKDENPVAYLGRWPGDDFDEAAGLPRYKWPAGFPKQQIVYGLTEALETPAEQPLIVVEGPFSVFHLVQVGFPATVAIFGSSMSSEQASRITASRRAVLLLFDGDEAGQAGMTKAAELLAPSAFVRLVSLDHGRQPDHLTAVELAAAIAR